jgi:hypothetical protein
MSKTKVIFGDAADGLVKFSESSANFGQSQQQYLDAAASFGIFGKAAGLTGDELGSFSSDLVSLSADMASFSNTTPEDAMIALQAALRGESEPIRRYGVLLDDASLRQKALELGIIATTKDALTPQQRVLAANALIWEQTADMQGDFSRTSEGFANQQRILSAQLENVKTTLGSALIPVVNTFMNMLTDFVSSEGFSTFLANAVVWLQNLAAWMGTNLPIAIAALSTFWTNVLQPAITAVWSWLSGTFIPFLQAYVVPILQVVIPAAIAVLKAAWEYILLPAIKAVWKFLSVDMKPVWDALVALLKVAIPLAINVLKGAWENVLKPAFQAIYNFVKTYIVPIFQKIGEAVGGITNAIQTVVGWIQTFTNMLKNIKLPDWLTPGSPTPFEMGLWGIVDALKAVNSEAVSASFTPRGLASRGGGRGNNFNMTVYTNAPSSTVMRDFNLMKAMAG